MGNYEIQAKLNISSHPEWNDEEKYDELLKGQIKDLTHGKTYREYRHQLFDLIMERTFDKLYSKNPFYGSFIDWPAGETNLQDLINEPIWKQPTILRHREEPTWETLAFKQN